MAANLSSQGRSVGSGKLRHEGDWPHEAVINVGPTERWLSALGGGLLFALGLPRPSTGGLLITLAGASLIHRGVSGHCPLLAALDTSTEELLEPLTKEHAIYVDRSITIDKPAEELYRFWRNLETLPQIMRHLKSVRPQDEKRSHWVAKGPMNVSIEWDAEITEDEANRRIAWRSVEGAQVANSGSVEFREAPAGRGTEVRVRLDYHPPAGALGAAVAKLFGEEPSQQIADDLRNVKRKLETGEIATTEGQPSGRA